MKNSISSKFTKTITQKPLTIAVLAIASAVTGSVAFAHGHQSSVLSKQDTQEVIEELADEMAASGYKVSFSTLPTLSYDESQDIELENIFKKLDAGQTLNNNDKQLLIKDMQTMLAMDGIFIDKPENLRLQPMSTQALEKLEQSYEAEYYANLKNLAKQMRDAGSVAKAEQILTKFYNEFEDFDDIVANDTQLDTSKVEVLNKQQTKELFDDLSYELAAMGYKLTYTDMPTVTIKPLTYNLNMDAFEMGDSTPLNAKQKSQLTDDMKQLLAIGGISADFNHSAPEIEAMSFNDIESKMAEDEAMFKAALNKLTKDVLNSRSVNEAVDLLAEFEENVFEENEDF